MSREYAIEPAVCGCPRYEIQEGVQPPKQMFGGHVDGCKAKPPAKVAAVKEAPAKEASESSTGKKGTK